MLCTEHRSELNAENAALREQSAMLLDHGEKARDQVLARHDDGFAEEQTALGPSDIENIRQGREIPEGNVINGRSELTTVKWEPQVEKALRFPVAEGIWRTEMEIRT